MKNKIIKTLILLICLAFAGSVYADVEEEVIVVTNVDYTATLTKQSSSAPVTMNPLDGTHSGLSTVFTLQTNGGDDHFDYIITSYINAGGGTVPAYGDDGRLLFAHEINPPSSTAISNALSGSGSSRNVFAYPTQVTATGGVQSQFKTNYKDYGNCHAIFVDDATSTTVTHIVQGTPCTNTYEVGADEAGNYKSTILFTIVSK